MLGTSGDGAPPWKHRAMGKYTIYFVSSEILNFPFHIMSDFSTRLLHVIWPGPKKPSCEQVNLGLAKLVSDANALWLPRLVHPDCPPVRLLPAIWSADYPGAGEILMMENSGAQWGCHRCFLPSSSQKGSTARCWGGNAAFLPDHHRFREWFGGTFKNKTVTLRGEKEAVAMRQVVHANIRELNDPNKRIAICGYKGLCELDRLHGNCGTINSVCIDGFHCIAGLVKRYWIPMFKVLHRHYAIYAIKD